MPSRRPGPRLACRYPVTPAPIARRRIASRGSARSQACRRAHVALRLGGADVRVDKLRLQPAQAGGHWASLVFRCWLWLAQSGHGSGGSHSEQPMPSHDRHGALPEPVARLAGLRVTGQGSGLGRTAPARARSSLVSRHGAHVPAPLRMLGHPAALRTTHARIGHRLLHAMERSTGKARRVSAISRRTRTQGQRLEPGRGALASSLG